MMEQLNSRLAGHGGNLRRASELYGFTEREWLDFSANINPLGLSPAVKAAILQQLDTIVNYPDPEAVKCKQSIADYYDLSVETLVIGNGAVELIYLLTHKLHPRRVLIPAPTFSEYARAVQSLEDSEVIYYPLRPEGEFRIDVDEFINKLSLVDMCFLCNPNNPVGNVLRADELQKIIAAAASRRVWLVLDESFIDFIADSEKISCRHLVAHYDNVIIIHSLTKFFAIPGLRLGFGVMPKSLARSLEAAKDPWNVNNLAQAAAVAALQDKAYISATVDLIQREKQFMFVELNKTAGITAYWPAANFVFFRLEHMQYNALTLADAIACNGILIRDCSSYPGLNKQYLRVAVKKPAENRRLLGVLQNLLGVK